MGRASLPGDLKERVLSATRQEPSPTRRVAIATDLIILAATAAAVLNVFLAGGGIVAGQTFERSCVAAAWAIVAGVATWVAFGRGKSMLGRRRSVLVAVSVGALIAGAGIVSVGSSWHGAGGSFARALLMGTLTSTIILVGLVYARRGSELGHPRAAGVALGAASSAWAALLVELNQPECALGVALLAHALPMLFAMALGYALGGRVIVRRTR
jgi:hypothetical protein